MPRIGSTTDVGGLGAPGQWGWTSTLVQNHIGDIRGCPLGPAMLKRDENLFEIPGMFAQAHCLQWVHIRDGDVTPFYMTFGLLPF